MAADRAKLSIEIDEFGSRGWAFDFCESQPANTHLTLKIGDLKTPPLNYGQTVADGATL